MIQINIIPLGIQGTCDQELDYVYRQSEEPVIINIILRYAWVPLSKKAVLLNEMVYNYM